MTNEEAIINGVDFEETVSEFELLFDEWHNKEFCTMTRIRDYAEYYKEENTKLKAEIEQYKKETAQDKIDYAYDLGYQSCLNHNGVSWKDAEEIQKLRKEIKRLKSELEQSVKEKSEVISKIEYALNECEPIYNKCAVIPQAKPVYDLAMNYCLDLLKGQVPE